MPAVEPRNPRASQASLPLLVDESAEHAGGRARARDQEIGRRHAARRRHRHCGRHGDLGCQPPVGGKTPGPGRRAAGEPRPGRTGRRRGGIWGPFVRVPGPLASPASLRFLQRVRDLFLSPVCLRSRHLTCERTCVRDSTICCVQSCGHPRVHRVTPAWQPVHRIHSTGISQIERAFYPVDLQRLFYKCNGHLSILSFRVRGRPLVLFSISGSRWLF